MTPHKERPVDDEDNDRRDQHWHVTRGIPVVFLATTAFYVVVQVALGAWYASSMNARVDAIERAQTQMAPQGERLTRVEEKLVAVQTGIADIKTLLQAPAKPAR